MFVLQNRTCVFSRPAHLAFINRFFISSMGHGTMPARAAAGKLTVQSLLSSVHEAAQTLDIHATLVDFHLDFELFIRRLRRPCFHIAFAALLIAATSRMRAEVVQTKRAQSWQDSSLTTADITSPILGYEQMFEQISCRQSNQCPSVRRRSRTSS